MKRSRFGFIIALLLACFAVSVSATETGVEPKNTLSYTATAILQILPTPPHILSTSEQRVDPIEFKSYKLTQAELIKSPFVIIAALRNLSETIKTQPHALPSLQEAEKNHCAVTWLGEKLRVKFPRPGSEIMTVSLTLPNAEEAAALVNTVVKAYFDEVVNMERLIKKMHFIELQTFSAENENTLRTKQTELRQLAENLGVIVGHTPGLAEALENQGCKQIQAELQRMKIAYAAGERRMRILTRMLEENQADEISPTECAEYLQQNSTEYRDLLQKTINLGQAARQEAKNINQTKSDHASTSSALSKEELTNIADRVGELRKAAVDQVRIERRIAITRELKQLQSEKQISQNQIGEMSAELDSKMKSAIEMTRTSIDVEMKRAEINNLERLLQNVNTEKDRLRVELKAPSRVEIVGDQNNPAPVPESPDKLKKKAPKK